MTYLKDGCYVPSSISGSTVRSNFHTSMNQVSLRIGTIVAKYTPNSSDGATRTENEYDVKVVYSNSTGPETHVLFHKVKMSSLFGGVADRFFWAPRLQKKEDDTEVDEGSVVLLLCVNGNQRNSYIIGGIRHPKTKKQQYDGLFLDWEYNGINATVNNDGELLISRKGATNDDGSVKSSASEKAGGSIFLDKNGEFRIGFSNNIDKDACGLFFSKPNKSLELWTEGESNFKIDKGFNITTPNITVNPGDFNQQAWLRGNDYRTQQQILNQLTSKLLSVLSTVISATSAMMISSGTALTVPVVGGIVGGPLMVLAGTLLQGAQITITAMSQAIDNFEAQSQTYLSTAHKFGDNP